MSDTPEVLGLSDRIDRTGYSCWKDNHHSVAGNIAIETSSDDLDRVATAATRGWMSSLAVLVPPMWRVYFQGLETPKSMMNVQHVCDECGTRFPTAGELRNHASANHQGHQTSGLLTDANASAIRGRMPFGPPGVEFCKELAGELGIHWITVANIASGQSYKRVKAYPPEHPLRLALNERNAARQRIRDKVKPAMRRELGEGQEWRCVYCFRDISKRSSIDHIVPLDQGGDSAMGNLQLVCLRCNQSKGAMSDVDYRVKINRIQQALHRREERAKSGGWSSYEASQRFYDCPCHHYGCYPDCTGCEMCEHNENSPPLRVVCPAGEFGFQDCPTEQECISVRECLSARRSKAITKLNGACQ